MREKVAFLTNTESSAFRRIELLFAIFRHSFQKIHFQKYL